MKDKICFKQGLIAGIPIALGYFAVSFSLGIQAKNAGISCFHASLMSLVNLTSAGEFAGIGLIAASGTYIEMAISQAIINMRYLLMSCALSQKFDSNRAFFHRFIVAFGITDEIFGISISQNEKLNPFFSYGAMSVAIPGWVLGTSLGVIMGNILPDIIISALSIAIYGMFIAIIIPPAKQDKHLALAIIIAMVSSIVWQYIPFVKHISSGTKIIILTVLISLIFALLFPVNDEVTNHE